MDEIEKIANGNVLFTNTLSSKLIQTALPNSSVENGSGSTIKITPKGSYDSYGFCWKQVTVIKTASGVLPLPVTKNAMIKLLVEDIFIDPSAAASGSIASILALMQGGIEPIDLIEFTTLGVKVTPSGKLSVSILFLGSGGTFNGLTVPNGFSASWSGTFKNEVGTKNFTVPTGADFSGFMKVLVSTTEI